MCLTLHEGSGQADREPKTQNRAPVLDLKQLLAVSPRRQEACHTVAELGNVIESGFLPTFVPKVYRHSEDPTPK